MQVPEMLTAFQIHASDKILKMCIFSGSFLTADPNDAQVFLRQALRLLREVSHDCKQASEMEMKQHLWIGLHQGLQAFVQGCVALGVIVRDEPTLHSGPDGFQL